MKKTVLCTFSWGNRCWKKNLRPCVSLPALKKKAPRQHHFILCCIHIFSVLKSNSHPVSDREDGRWGLQQEKSCLLTPCPPHPTRGLRRCFLRTSTGGAEGKHPKRREFRLSLRHINTTIYACTLTHSQPYAHAYTHTNQNNSSKSF